MEATYEVEIMLRGLLTIALVAAFSFSFFASGCTIRSHLIVINCAAVSAQLMDNWPHRPIKA